MASLFALLAAAALEFKLEVVVDASCPPGTACLSGMARENALHETFVESVKMCSKLVTTGNTIDE